MVPLLDIYIYIENGEYHTKLFDKRDNFGLNIVRMPFYCFNVPSKMFYGCIGAEFLVLSRATSKMEDFSRTCRQLLSQVLKQNGQMSRIKFSFIKMIQRHQEIFIKYKKLIEEVMQAKGFSKQNIKNLNVFFYIHSLHIVRIFYIFCL